MSNETDFDPGRYLTKVSGSDYLEVKWRLLWLRTTHPDAAIDTEMISHDGQFAVFKAKVWLPDGGSATGYGSEQYNDFRDYIEKAETKAIGRALAALGFGTQFCPDFEFGADNGRIVDAPVRRQDAPRDLQPQRQASGATRTGNHEQAATPRQIQFIAAIARELGMSEEALRAESSQSFSRDVSALNRRDASIFIERLQQRRVDRGMNPPPTRNNNPSGPPEPMEPDIVDDNNIDTQAMIADFDRRHPADAAKFRQ
jgi:hypothetical protein